MCTWMARECTFIPRTLKVQQISNGSKEIYLSDYGRWQRVREGGAATHSRCTTNVRFSQTGGTLRIINIRTQTLTRTKEILQNNENYKIYELI